MSFPHRACWLMLAGVALAACGQKPATRPVDAGSDAGAVDAGPTDAGKPDAAVDAGEDAGADGGEDAGLDAGTDAGSADGGEDAGVPTWSGEDNDGGTCCDQVTCDTVCGSKGLMCSQSCTCITYVGPSQCVPGGCPRGETCLVTPPSECDLDAGAVGLPTCPAADAGFSTTIDGGTCCDLGVCMLACGANACSNSCACAAATNAMTGNIPCTSDAVCPLGELCYNASYCIPGTSQNAMPECPLYACNPLSSSNACPTFQSCGANGFCQ